jgi:hypothetical protein
MKLATLVLALAVIAAPVSMYAAPVPAAGVSITAPASSPSSPSGALALAVSLALFGTIVVKDVSTIARKFVRNAQAAQGDYVEGVKGAGAAWEAGARAGAENFATGVQQAIADGRFAKGVAQAGAGKYATNAEKKGGQRFGPGVAGAEGDFARGVAPVLDTIRNITLPPRRPKGDPGNMQRSQAIAVALRALKVGRPG